VRRQTTWAGLSGGGQRLSSAGKSSRASATDRSLRALCTMMPLQASLASAIVSSVWASTSALKRFA
jgi:hypothetical protein